MLLFLFKEDRLNCVLLVRIMLLIVDHLKELGSDIGNSSHKLVILLLEGVHSKGDLLILMLSSRIGGEIH